MNDRAARRRGWAAAYVVLAAMAATTAVAGEAGFLFAEFGDGGNAAMNGARVGRVAYSERPGDALLHSVDSENKTMVVRGLVSNQKNSKWAGVGLNVAANAAGHPVDLTGYRTMKIQLGSTTARWLRVRISGSDSQVLDSGCYPVTLVTVTPTLTEYRVPLRRFNPEFYCGNKGHTLSQVIGQVHTVEVVDAVQNNKGSQFSVGRIEFLQ